MTGDGAQGVDGMAVRCRGLVDEVDELVARVRGLPPPTWRGPAADELAARLARAGATLDEGAAAVEQAGAAARLVGG